MFHLPEYREPDFTQDKFVNAPDAAWEAVTIKGVAPENYHSTSMYPEYFKIDGQWKLAKESRMDSSVVLGEDGELRVVENRNLEVGDKVILGRTENEYIQWLCEEDTQIVTDHRYLYRICQNLMENTLKYSAKGTHVFVKTCVTAEDQVKLEITNTANYLMNFRKEDIVERFARGDAARTTEGNGLGLAIVSTYAEALGGTFDLRIDCDQFKAILLLPRGKLPAEL